MFALEHAQLEWKAQSQFHVGGANGGEIIGVLGVATFAPREYSPEETVALLECGRAVAELLGASAQLDHTA